MEGRVEAAGWDGRVWPGGSHGWPPARLGKAPRRERVVRGLLIGTVSVVGVEAGARGREDTGGAGEGWRVKLKLEVNAR